MYKKCQNYFLSRILAEFYLNYKKKRAMKTVSNENKLQNFHIFNMINKYKQNSAVNTKKKILNEIDNIHGIDVKLLLKTINKRIETLYNRDHIIGHPYFMSLVNKSGNEAKNELDNIFKNRVIPMLQKYFNNDWEKIRVVLGDNHKEGKDKKYQFLKEKKNTYEINEKAFDSIDSYKKIYE